MTMFVNWIALKRDLIELWVLNGTIAAISFSDLPSILISFSAATTFLYTIWKWRQEIVKKKK